MNVRSVGMALLVVLVGVSIASADRTKPRRRKAKAPAATEVTQPAPPPEAPAPAEADTAPVDPAPAAAPAPTEPQVAPADDSTAEPALAELRAEYADVMDSVVQLRSRVAVLGRQLFETRVRVHVMNETGGTQTLARLEVFLDGAPVHKGDGPLKAGRKQVFDGFAAPGPHVLTLELEQRARADAKYVYTQRQTFRFEVKKGKANDITLTLEDDSDIAEDFADDGEGAYDVRTEMRVETRNL